MHDAGERDQRWILTALFEAAVSGDPARYARERGFDPAFLPMWREQYHLEYIAYLEAFLRAVKDRVDDWPIG
jgi:hypothetical protein